MKKIIVLLGILTVSILFASTESQAVNIYGSCTVCSTGNSGTVYLDDFIGTVVIWEKGEETSNPTDGTPNITWTEILGTAGKKAITYKDLVKKTFYRARLLIGGKTENSEEATVRVIGSPVAGTVSVSATNICAGTNVDFTLSGNQSKYIYWQQSTNGISWSSFEFGLYDNQESFTAPVNATIWIRADTRNDACDPEYSNSIKINATPQTNPGTLDGNTTVCIGDNSGTVSLAGNNGSIVRWEYGNEVSKGNIIWKDLGFTGSSYTYNNLTQKTFYRVFVRNSPCSLVSTNIVTIDVVFPPFAGALNISPIEGTCAGEETTVSVNTVTGGEFFWECSSNGANWISFENGAYDNQLSFSHTFINDCFLRVRAENSYCNPVYSDIGEVVILPATVSGSLTGTDTVCVNDNEGELIISEYEGEIKRWQFSNTGGNPWTDIANQTNTHTFKNLTHDTWYRVFVRNGTCPGEYSNKVKITTIDPPNPAEITGADEVCSGLNTVSLTLENYEGEILQWEKRIEEAEWEIINYTDPTFNIEDIIHTTYFRVLVANDYCSPVYSTEKQVIANEIPHPGFSFEDQCLGDSVSFVDASTISIGSISEYHWTFGDGSTSALQNPKYLYSYPVTYNVQLKVVSSKGCADSLTDQVQIHPVPSIEYLHNNVCDEQFMFFENESFITSGNLSFLWEFGDGTMSTDQGDVSHLYNTFGQYSVKLFGTSEFGCKDSVQKNVEVYFKGVSDFSVDSVCYGEQTIFTNLSDSGNGSLSYNWDLGDGRFSSEFEPNCFYDSAGFYNVKLITTTDHNCKDTSENVAVVWHTPIADYTAGDICIGDTVSFTNLSTIGSGEMNYIWSFGDSSLNSFEVNPIHVYNEKSVYNTKLVVISENNCIDSAEETLYSNSVANFSVNNVCLGEQTSFVNSSILPVQGGSYFWSFGNGINSNLDNPFIIYQNYGTYEVTLIIETHGLCYDTAVNFADVYALPEASFTVQDGCEDDSITFTDNSSIPVGDFTRHWNFDDGSTDSLSVNPLHVYLEGGLYSPKLVVTSNHNCKDSTTQEIEIFDRPVVDFISDSVCQGEFITFQNLTNFNGNIGYQWTFGDGSTSVMHSPSHLYEDADLYDVQLLGTSSDGCSDSITKIAVVYPTPQAAFNVEDICFGYNAAFNNQTPAYNYPVIYVWDFGDGESSNEESPEHYYSAPGLYEAMLEVSTEQNCETSISHDVNVFPSPEAGFVIENVCFGNTSWANSTSTISSGYITHYWNLGDGTTSTVSSPEFIYDQPGLYEVKLKVVSNFGCEDSTAKTTEVYNVPIADFVFNDVCDGVPVFFSNTSYVQTGPIIESQWEFGDGNISSDFSSSNLYLNPGNYLTNLKVFSEHNCIAEISKIVTVNPGPLANFSVEGACVGNPVEPINISIPGVSGENLFYVWHFTNSDVYTTENPTHVYSSYGLKTIKLKVNSDFGCSDSVARYVEVYPLPNVDAGNDTVVSLGQSIELNATGAESYIWDPAEELQFPFAQNPVATPTDNIKFFVIGTDEYGCENIDSVLISVVSDYNVFMTNIITPNGDGVNDCLVIKGIEAYPDSEITIYDRWGKQVFSTVSYMNDWKGTHNSNGDLMDDGTYYYVVTFKNNPDKILKGAITIISNN